MQGLLESTLGKLLEVIEGNESSHCRLLSPAVLSGGLDLDEVNFFLAKNHGSMVKNELNSSDNALVLHL